MKVYSGSAKLTAYTRDASGREVYVNDYSALARAIHGARTFGAYAPGLPYGDGDQKSYAMLYWRVVADDAGALIEDTELEIANQESTDLNFYVEYLNNDGLPYTNDNLDGRTFGPGKRVVFSAAAFLKLPVPP